MPKKYLICLFLEKKMVGKVTLHFGVSDILLLRKRLKCSLNYKCEERVGKMIIKLYFDTILNNKKRNIHLCLIVSQTLSFAQRYMYIELLCMKIMTGCRVFSIYFVKMVIVYKCFLPNMCVNSVCIVYYCYRMVMCLL